MKRIGLFVLAMVAGASTGPASAQSANSIVKYSDSRILDTRAQFVRWCKKTRKNAVIADDQLAGRVLTTCSWKDKYKRQYSVMHGVSAERVNLDGATCLLIFYPRSLYNRVDEILKARLGPKTRDIVTSDGLNSRGWTFELGGRMGALSNMIKSGEGFLYECFL